MPSQAIKAMRYEAKLQLLTILFRGNAKTYVYLAVPATEWDAFMAGESRGKYLNQVFKQKGYSFRVLPPDLGGPDTPGPRLVPDKYDVHEWGETRFLPRREDVIRYLRGKAAYGVTIPASFLRSVSTYVYRMR